MKQSNVAGVHGKHTAISPLHRVIYFVQAPIGFAKDRAGAATKIIEMKGDEFTAGNRKIERKLLSGGYRSSANALPFSYDSAKSRRQSLKMVRLPIVLRHSTERECGFEHSQQAKKCQRHRANSSHCNHFVRRNRKSCNPASTLGGNGD